MLPLGLGFAQDAAGIEIVNPNDSSSAFASDKARPYELTAWTVNLPADPSVQFGLQFQDSSAAGSGDGDALASAVDDSDTSELAGEVALFFGLGFALLSMTTAMAQVERGANRIYGIRRDRKALHKYGRAAVLTAVLAVPVGVGVMMIVGGLALGEAMAENYGWSERSVLWWNVLRWPLGIGLLVFAIAVLLDHAPRRRQPALSWLALGSGIAVVLNAFATAGLAAYVSLSGSFGSVYGPLAGVFALLLWALLSSIAFFYGTAVCAQLEALRAGDTTPALDDPGRPHARTVGDQATG